jgi:hypothetical protein
MHPRRRLCYPDGRLRRWLAPVKDACPESYNCAGPKKQVGAPFRRAMVNSCDFVRNAASELVSARTDYNGARERFGTYLERARPSDDRDGTSTDHHSFWPTFGLCTERKR